jgi:SAM-dependent methyltransferase
MSDSSQQAHWQGVYTAKGEKEVSWYQDKPAPSLDLIALTGASRGTPIVDIGGGASRLVDHLLDRNFERLTVLDLSAAALEAAKARLGEKAKKIRWEVADITRWSPPASYAVWHDRAAFHFLTDPADQAAYAERVRRAVEACHHRHLRPRRSGTLQRIADRAARCGFALCDSWSGIHADRRTAA